MDLWWGEIKSTLRCTGSIKEWSEREDKGGFLGRGNIHVVLQLVHLVLVGGGDGGGWGINMRRRRQAGLGRRKRVCWEADRDMQWLVTATLYLPGRPTHPPSSAYQTPCFISALWHPIPLSHYATMPSVQGKIILYIYHAWMRSPL